MLTTVLSTFVGKRDTERSSTTSLMEKSRRVAVPVPGLHFPAATGPLIFSEAATAENWCHIISPKKLGRVSAHLFDPHVGFSVLNKAITGS